MNQETQAALERLEQALLAEEEAVEEAEAPEEEFPMELSEEEPTEGLLTESVVDDTLVFRNFSNNYGADLRNYASGYQARNTDKTDVDLEEYADQVAEEEKTAFPWMPLLTAVLEAVIVGYMAVVVFGGLL